MCVLRRGAARHGQGATAQVVCEHVEERRLFVGRDQSEYVFELVLLLVSQHAPL